MHTGIGEIFRQTVPCVPEPPGVIAVSVVI
jgi:hypothetical protein